MDGRELGGEQRECERCDHPGGANAPLRPRFNP
jgi:hypothetical protein